MSNRKWTSLHDKHKIKARYNKLCLVLHKNNVKKFVAISQPIKYTLNKLVGNIKCI